MSLVVIQKEVFRLWRALVVEPADHSADGLSLVERIVNKDSKPAIGRRLNESFHAMRSRPKMIEKSNRIGCGDRLTSPNRADNDRPPIYEDCRPSV